MDTQNEKKCLGKKFEKNRKILVLIWLRHPSIVPDPDERSSARHYPSLNSDTLSAQGLKFLGDNSLAALYKIAVSVFKRPKIECVRHTVAH